MKYAITAILTLISGALSGYFLFSETQMLTNYGPGIFFGLAILIVLRMFYKAGPVRLLLWFFGSVLAWYAALQVYIVMGVTGNSTVIILPNMLVAGVLGGAVLGIVFAMAAGRKDMRLPLLGALLGTVLALVMFGVLSLPIQDEEIMNKLLLPLAFAIWQIGIGLMFVFEQNRFLASSK